MQTSGNLCVLEGALRYLGVLSGTWGTSGYFLVFGVLEGVCGSLFVLGDILRYLEDYLVVLGGFWGYLGVLNGTLWYLRVLGITRGYLWVIVGNLWVIWGTPKYPQSTAYVT